MPKAHAMSRAQSLILALAVTLGICLNATFFPNRVSGQQDPTQKVDQQTIQRTLEKLTIKRAKFAENLGEGHPTIRKLDEQIRRSKQLLQVAPESDDPLVRLSQSAFDETSDGELREIVGLLVKRVVELEHQTETLKEEVRILRSRR